MEPKPVSRGCSTQVETEYSCQLEGFLPCLTDLQLLHILHSPSTLHAWEALSFTGL